MNPVSINCPVKVRPVFGLNAASSFHQMSGELPRHMPSRARPPNP